MAVGKYQAFTFRERNKDGIEEEVICAIDTETGHLYYKDGVKEFVSIGGKIKCQRDVGLGKEIVEPLEVTIVKVIKRRSVFMFLSFIVLNC